MEYTAYFNGSWVPNSEIRIDPFDRGFLVGDVVFETERTFNGKVFRLREHIERLYRSLTYTRIDSELSLEEMLDISEEVVRRNEHLRSDVGDFTVHQFVTRGKNGPRYRARDAGPPTVSVRVSPVSFGRYAGAYSSGVHGVISRVRSYSSESLDPKIKTYSRMHFNLAEMEVADIDPEGWPILTDLDGHLTEGTSYNVFLVTDGVIRTPTDRAVLQGVSRGMVFDLAHQLDIPVVEEDLQPYDLYTSDEAFFTTTSPCVVPVTKADNRQIAEGKPGPITLQLLAAWSESAGLDIVDQALMYAKD